MFDLPKYCQMSAHLSHYQKGEYDSPKLEMLGYINTGLVGETEYYLNRLRYSVGKPNRHRAHPKWNRSFFGFLKSHKEILGRFCHDEVWEAGMFIDFNKMKELALFPNTIATKYIVATLWRGCIYVTVRNSLTKKDFDFSSDTMSEIGSLFSELSTVFSPTTSTSTGTKSTCTPSKSRSSTSSATSSSSVDDVCPNLINHAGHVYGVFMLNMYNHKVIYPQIIDAVVQRHEHELTSPPIDEQDAGIVFLSEHEKLLIRTSKRLPEDVHFKTYTLRAIWLECFFSKASKAIIEFDGIKFRRMYTLKDMEELCLDWHPSVAINFLRNIVSFIKYQMSLELMKLDYPRGQIKKLPIVEIIIEKQYGINAEIKRDMSGVTLNLIPKFFLRDNEAYPEVETRD